MIPVSLLSAYSYCPRKIFLERVLKLAEPPKEATIKGTLRHEAFDALNRSEESVVTSIRPGQSTDSIQESYKKAVAARVRNSIIEKKDSIRRLNLEPNDVFVSVMKQLQAPILMRVQNVVDFIQKSNLYGEELWLELTPKIKSEYKVSSEPLRLNGVVDQVKVMRDILVPVELKTGQPPKEGVWPGHRLQVAAYIMLLEDQFDMNINKGIIRYLDSSQEREVLINPFLRQEVIDTRIKIEKLISQSSLPERIKNENKCEKCGLRDDCYNDLLMTAKERGLKEKHLNKTLLS